MKFTKKEKRDIPQISTASLPDIIFMLLFFFMVTTVIRNNQTSIAVKIPHIDAIEKPTSNDQINLYLPDNILASEDIYVNQEKVSISHLNEYLATKTKHLTSYDKSQIEVNLYATQEAPMKLLHEIKKALRRNELFHLSYLTK